IACRGEGGPCFKIFPVIPATCVGQFDRRIDRLDLRAILSTDALNTQDVNARHGTPSQTTGAEQGNDSASSPDLVRRACRLPVERRFPGGEAEPGRTVSARSKVIARRTVTCCQTTNAGSC